MVWKFASGMIESTLSVRFISNKFYRQYTATYWPNKGIAPTELQKIYNKIQAADKKLTGEGSPENESNNVDYKTNGSYHTSPPR